MINKNASYYDPCDTGQTNSCAAGSVTGSGNEEKVWNFFASKQLKPIAIAGIMGNFYQENSYFDPARKQSDAMIAIPDKGDGKTGYGIAQWTSAGRQELLFTQIRNASLQEYYGAGWGSAEKDKDIPAANIDKLLGIELEFAWSGDTTKIKDIATQLNAATSVEGNNGSAVLFHRLYERSGDDASQIQERVNSASDMLKKYGGGGGALSSGSCSTGQLGGVSTTQDAVAWAMKFVADTGAKYHPGGHKINAVVAGDSTEYYWTNDRDVGDAGCWRARFCGQCTALSGWFVTNETGYTFGGGDGGEVVGRMKALGAPTGNQPKPYSVFSYSIGRYGHTGVVLGVLANGDVITIENNWPTDGVLVVRKYNIMKEHPDATFAYTADKLKVNVN